MKRLYFLLVFITITGLAKAQDDDSKKQQDIYALQVAFISKELDLTPTEAQKFWPIYNQYSKELLSTLKDDQDIIDRDEKVLNLRKRYRDQFSQVLGAPRVNNLWQAEGRFRQVLIKTMKRQRQMQQQNRQNRPLRRNQ